MSVIPSTQCGMSDFVARVCSAGAVGILGCQLELSPADHLMCHWRSHLRAGPSSSKHYPRLSTRSYVHGKAKSYPHGTPTRSTKTPSGHNAHTEVYTILSTRSIFPLLVISGSKLQ